MDIAKRRRRLRISKACCFHVRIIWSMLVVVIMSVTWHRVAVEVVKSESIDNTVHDKYMPNQQPLQQQQQPARIVRDQLDVSKSASTAAQNTRSASANSQKLANTTTTIAFAVSIIKCGDHQSTAAGLIDAALVLRHSIHLHSIRNGGGGGKYDYKMYAIVHINAAKCVLNNNTNNNLLASSFDEIIVKNTPFNVHDISSPFLRQRMDKEWCCGSDEFVKLYAYTLPEPIVVHVDVDFIFTKPLDDLFDVMLLNDDEVTAAKSRIAREKKKVSNNDNNNNNTMVIREPDWPDRVDAFFTRDWPQVMPGRKSLYQAGFIVTRTSQAVFDEIVQVILTTEYVEGTSRLNGWGGLGYGSLVGAMAMQGLMAYYYDVVRPNTWVELNQCRYNHMGMDVRWRSPPSFVPRHRRVGDCRNNLTDCEDCMVTSLADIYSIHYTQCRKPWNCIGEAKTHKSQKMNIPTNSVHLDHCLELQTVWHTYRIDLEDQLYALTGDNSIVQYSRNGAYNPEVFKGHCKGNGGEHYQAIAGKTETMARIRDLYKYK